MDRVVMRRWRDGSREVFALFPDVDEGDGLCSSYQHVGQHGGASYALCIRLSRPAAGPDADELLDELRGIGYRPLVYKRRPPR